jgi:Cft2 family RNA processing exonuclease
MPYRQQLEFGRLRLTAYPAGHCLGSAMLLAEDGEQSLLYTGDFKLDRSATAEPAELPQADILIMESTYGLPSYRLPPRSDVIEQFLEAVVAALADGRTPVIHAYPLGKSQEVTRILTDHGIPVLQHPSIYGISCIYRECGVDLGNFEVFHSDRVEGHAVVTLPRGRNSFRLAGMRRTVSMAVTGWALDGNARNRFGVDYAFPLSDHADFDQLIEAVRRVAPRVVYCTHGPPEFADHLRDLGFNAAPLHPPLQRQLF